MCHFSEQNWLDTDTLGEHLLSSAVSEVTVLLLATAASSYLWFDEEHCPRNVELCTFLKSHSVNVKFVVCPTTNSARDAWEQHTPNLPSVFGEFLPETGIVDVWPDFDPDHPVEPQQIRSLIRHVQTFPQRELTDHHHKTLSEWPRTWYTVLTGIGGLLLLWALRKQALHQKEILTLQEKVTELQIKLDALSQHSDPWSYFLSGFEAFVVPLPPVQWILEKFEFQAAST